MTIEHKTFPLKASVTASGSLEGHAAIFNNLDDGGDIILPGFFADVLPDFLSNGFMSWNHDWGKPIGMPTGATEDGKGLAVSATFHSDAESQRYRTIASERLAAGKSMGLSIGYEVAPGGAERTPEARLLKKAGKLFEFGLVMVPMNRQAQAAAVKGAKAASDNVSTAVYCLTALNDLIQEEAQDVTEGSATDAADLDYLTQARDALLLFIEAESAEIGTTADLVDVAEEDAAAVAQQLGYGFMGKPGVPFLTHLASVTAAVKAAASRSRAVARLRKEGRVLSSANVTRLEGLVEALAAAQVDLSDLLASVNPDTAKAARDAEVEYLLDRIREYGVIPVTH